MKSYGLFREDSQDVHGGKVRMKGQLPNPRFLGKWPLNV